MKALFDERRTLIVQAEDYTEAFALDALASKLAEQGIYLGWVVFDLNVPEKKDEVEL